jgi:arylsulfatase
MREYKVHVKVLLPENTHMNIDYSTIQDVGLARWLFNRYIDPKETMPVGHRMNAWLATVTGKLKAHGATFKECPPKEIGLDM